ncbi:hypothetical protein EMCRGX_G020420 [Ephydatia muelleri]
MDQTELFRAVVKAVRLQLKAQREATGSGTSVHLSSFKTTKKLTQFTAAANDVFNCISKLEDFLLKHRKDYINSVDHLVADCSRMSDAERDQIDLEAKEFIMLCSEKIRKLQQELTPVGLSSQELEHRDGVHHYLQDYLKDVCKLYSEQRAVRVKRIVDRKRISRLQLESLKKVHTSTSTPASDPPAPEPMSLATGNNVGTAIARGEAAQSAITREATPPPPPPTGMMGAIPPVSSGGAGPPAPPGGPAELVEGVDRGHLSPDERKEFEQENLQLFEALDSLVDEVRQIEGKVIEISRLQEIFTEKVLEQASELDKIEVSAVQSGVNVKDGNEQVRSAIKNKASIRLWILFVLVMCSFSLLFLEWYS